MPNKVIVTSDSTCDLSPELIERYGVKILPLGVTLNGDTYTDGVDINPEMIYSIYEKTGVLPKTSACNLAQCEDFFSPIKNEGYDIVHFTISSEMSSTYNNTRMAAEDFDGIYVVDSRNLSTGGGLLVIAACEMALKGMPASEIAAECEKLALQVDASFVIDNLEFLHKGGRCSALASFGANLLNLKPCITVKDGKMGVSKKYRGKFSVVLQQYLKDRLGDGSDIIKDRVFITHAGCDDEIVNACVDTLNETCKFNEVFVTRAGCTVSSHCGRNTLGVLFIRKEPLV